MSTTSATFRVISSRPDARPDRERLELAAKALSDLGLDVVRVGRFGVSVHADEQQLEALFGVQVPERSGLLHQLENPPESLKGLVDLLEIVPEPSLYARKAL